METSVLILLILSIFALVEGLILMMAPKSVKLFFKDLYKKKGFMEKIGIVEVLIACLILIFITFLVNS